MYNGWQKGMTYVRHPHSLFFLSCSSLTTLVTVCLQTGFGHGGCQLGLLQVPEQPRLPAPVHERLDARVERVQVRNGLEPQGLRLKAHPSQTFAPSSTHLMRSLPTPHLPNPFRSFHSVYVPLALFVQPASIPNPSRPFLPARSLCSAVFLSLPSLLCCNPSSSYFNDPPLSHTRNFAQVASTLS